MNILRFTPTLLTAAVLAAAPLAQAATTQATAASMSKAERQKAWSGEKDMLEKALATGKDKATYRSELEKMGYWITAVNTDTPSRLEYEIVKGDHSYEVQIDLANNLGTKVDVTTNLWRAPATKAAMARKDYKYSYPTAVTENADKVRDSVRSKTWLDEKGRLEAALGTGHDRAYYKAALEKQGYKVTHVNENDKKNLEYEIVKGDTSYEVQVDFDAKTAKSTRVGVSSNAWETPATERAKSSGS